MDEQDLTPLQLSLAQTGRRYFKADSSTYSALAAGVDATRGYPESGSTPTLRGMRPVEQLKTANDGSGYVLVSIDAWRFTSGDDAMLAPAVGAGLLVELTADDYQSLLPTE